MSLINRYYYYGYANLWYCCCCCCCRACDLYSSAQLLIEGVLLTVVDPGDKNVLLNFVGAFKDQLEHCRHKTSILFSVPNSLLTMSHAYNNNNNNNNYFLSASQAETTPSTLSATSQHHAVPQGSSALGAGLAVGAGPTNQPTIFPPQRRLSRGI